MVILIDSREKSKAIKSIVTEFDSRGIKHYSSKLFVGDYMSLDNPKVIIDRKQNLTELTSNVCQDHERFRRELQRAKDAGIQLIILVEHGKGINCLEDIIFWENPRQTVETKAMKGETLYKVLQTQQRKYGVKFEFCDKADTGKRIIETLSRE